MSTATTPIDLQKAAREHLWMHFTRMGGYASNEVPIIVRGDGCYLEDANGKRYLDALAGLFSVNIGYGFGEEIGQAALDQMRELPFYTNWSYAHPRAIELASELASLAPGDLNRAFFVSGGSEAVESAWKLARQYYLARGGKRVPADETRHDERVGTPPPRRYKAIARQVAYHGTTMGALSINGIPALKETFEPLVPEVRHVKNTNRYHRPPEETEAEFTAMLLENLEEAILAMGPETICLVHMEPVQNAGGAFTPPEGYWAGVRALCDRYDILLSADEVITGFGRVGHWFASERYDIRPDIICCAKGLSSSYAAIGAVLASDKVMAPFLEDSSMYAHGITFGGHPVMSAIALKNIEIMKRERILERVLGNEGAFRATLETLLDLPIVGDVRGTGYFYAIELVKDKETRRDVQRRGVRDAAPRLPLPGPVRAGPDLPRRRPRRPGDPDLPAARRRPGRVRRDGRDPRRRPHGGGHEDERRLAVDADQQQLGRLLSLVAEVLGPDVVGAYLFGSAVLGGLRPESDLDVLVVARRPTTRPEKARLVDALLALSGQPQRLELTIAVDGALDFQYGDWWRSEFVERQRRAVVGHGGGERPDRPGRDGAGVGPGAARPAAGRGARAGLPAGPHEGDAPGHRSAAGGPRRRHAQRRPHAGADLDDPRHGRVPLQGRGGRLGARAAPGGAPRRAGAGAGDLCRRRAGAVGRPDAARAVARRVRRRRDQAARDCGSVKVRLTALLASPSAGRVRRTA